MLNLPDRSPDALYLGDAVYADVERGMVRLTTEDGIQVINTIYLDTAVMGALLEWYDRLLAKYDREKSLPNT